MAAQGERVSGAIVMCSVVGEPMVQDNPEQDIGMQEQSPPQINSEPEMGVAAAEAAVYDTSPPTPLSTKTLPRSLPKRLTKLHPTWPNYSPCWRT